MLLEQRTISKSLDQDLEPSMSEFREPVTRALTTIFHHEERLLICFRVRRGPGLALRGDC
jgi:hypothetical protein